MGAILGGGMPECCAFTDVADDCRARVVGIGTVDDVGLPTVNAIVLPPTPTLSVCA